MGEGPKAPLGPCSLYNTHNNLPTRIINYINICIYVYIQCMICILQTEIFGVLSSGLSLGKFLTTPLFEMYFIHTYNVRSTGLCIRWPMKNKEILQENKIKISILVSIGHFVILFWCRWSLVVGFLNLS